MAERRAPARSRAAGRARVTALDPIHAALGADIGPAVLRRGAKAMWSPVLRLELAESYGFPDGFLGALRACLTVHDLLVAERASPRFVVWQRRWLGRRRAVATFGEGHLGPVRHHAGGVTAAEVTGVAAVHTIAWLGVATDYPRVRPSAGASLFLVDPRAGWVSHVYDDRGMEIAVRTPRAAAGLARRLTAAGFVVARS